jgi:hypothetical protein
MSWQGGENALRDDSSRGAMQVKEELLKVRDKQNSRG